MGQMKLHKYLFLKQWSKIRDIPQTSGNPEKGVSRYSYNEKEYNLHIYECIQHNRELKTSISH